jgi:hypothetical protein
VDGGEAKDAPMPMSKPTESEWAWVEEAVGEKTVYLLEQKQLVVDGDVMIVGEVEKRIWRTEPEVVGRRLG